MEFSHSPYRCAIALLYHLAGLPEAGCKALGKVLIYCLKPHRQRLALIVFYPKEVSRIGSASEN